MKAVMISIRPKWCEKIANGEKTIEVRKTRPKLTPPFKCYIYCTYGQGLIGYHDPDYPNMLLDVKVSKDATWGNCCNGKVIGEFVCDKITYFGNVATDPWNHLRGGTHEDLKRIVTEKACLSEADMLAYRGKYGWHISDLVIYEKPLELRQFVTEGDCDCANCRNCYWFDGGNGYNVEADCNLVYEYLGTGKTLKPLFRPPQSWCYVEGGEG